MRAFTGELRKLGQYLGLIYRDDGTWQLGPGRRREPPAPKSGSDPREPERPPIDCA